MKKHKLIGVLLLGFGVYTLVGMVLNNANFWLVYNYVAVVLSVLSGFTLLRQK